MGRLMPKKLPPHVDKNRAKGHTYLSFRMGKGPRIRLPDNPDSSEFKAAYIAALAGEMVTTGPTLKRDAPGTIGALIVDYKTSGTFTALRDTSKKGYNTRLETIRVEHGHRTVAGLTRDRINTFILSPLADRPGAQLDTLKKLRILVQHAIGIGLLKSDPTTGIKRPKTKEIRPWTDGEKAAFEKRWPIGTKQRTAYELMNHVGTARSDVHAITWAQVDANGVSYRRSKTGVAVDSDMPDELRAALNATPRDHVTIINTVYGRPHTVDGFSGFMRDAMKAAGLPLDCKPHGLRKSLGSDMADADASAHDIMAKLGHTTLKQAENYTRARLTGRGVPDAPARSWPNIRRTNLPKPPSKVWVKRKKNE
jgi:site-specific recombinase XerC